MAALLIVIFIVGYTLIAFEHYTKINKSAIALVTGVLCWTFYILFSADANLVNEQLSEQFSGIAEILFFLLGAMTIVELIDAHNGFEIITSKINQTDKRKLLWIISFITFFLSAVLDNLTTTIVMITLLRKLVHKQEDRLVFAGLIVIAANAGGAFTPIGDVTTTMLWIGGQISAGRIILKVLLPSLTCIIVPLLVISIKFKGLVDSSNASAIKSDKDIPHKNKSLIFFAGILALISVPVFKTFTNLPPFMGMLIGLGILWIITEIMYGQKEEKYKQSLSVASALRRIDTSSILFFLGILISIAALEASGILSNCAKWLTATVGNDSIIVISLGLLSSIIDNVPLVAAAQGMFDLSQYPMDHFFWEFLAYCAGTGGSILIIGSAAGVVAMGMEKIHFFWYLKKISFIALLGYLAGAAVYILQHLFLTSFFG
jgi:Na+/H+ antiporter NhaD/arsenite permease-like protein